MKNVETLKKVAERCGIALSTAFRWRHLFLDAAQEQSPDLNGIVVTDKTFFLESRKGQGVLDRKLRHQGGVAKKRGLTGEQVLALMTKDRGAQTFNKVLKVVNGKTLSDALSPAVNKGALPVADVNTRCPMGA